MILFFFYKNLITAAVHEVTLLLIEAFYKKILSVMYLIIRMFQHCVEHWAIMGHGGSMEPFVVRHGAVLGGKRVL